MKNSMWILAAAAALSITGAIASADPVTYSTNFDSMTTGSIYGQEGWADLNTNGTDGNNYVQGVTNAASHSGSQSWLLSNSYNDGTVRTIGTPTFAPVGESNTVYGGHPAYNQFTETFWFRSVSTTDDPGLYISNSLGTAASVRDTYVRIADDGGSLTVDALGGWDPTIGDFSQDPSVGGLTWGAWYEVKETATFVDGPDNDTVNYQVLDAGGTVLMNATIGSWEGFYSDPATGAEQAPGPIANNQISWGLSASPGVQGAYIDDLSLSVSDVSAVPLPASAWSGLALLVGLGLLSGGKRLRKQTA